MADHCERCAKAPEVYVTFKLNLIWTGNDSLVFLLCKECLSVVMEEFRLTTENTDYIDYERCDNCGYSPEDDKAEKLKVVAMEGIPVEEVRLVSKGKVTGRIYNIQPQDEENEDD